MSKLLSRDVISFLMANKATKSTKIMPKRNRHSVFLNE